MVLLGIEAAAKVAGAALYADGHIIAEHRLEGTLTHSETLMPMIDAVLKEIEKENIDKIICLGDFIGRSRKIRGSNTKNITNKRKMYMCQLTRYGNMN